MSKLKQSLNHLTIADPQGVLHEFNDQLESHIRQLKKLNWSPEDRPLRTIDILDIKLTAEESEKKPQHQILGVTDAPLVKLMFIEAGSSDVYRREIRKQATAWASSVASTRDPTGWIVAHYVGAKKPRSKGVWTKLVADVEADHAVQLYLDDVVGSQESWTNFVAHLKQQILNTFTARVTLYESEIRNLQSTRDVVGWNFGKLFVMQESLAWSFEKMNFIKEAIQIYTSLETMAEPAFFTESESPAETDVSKGLLESDRETITSKMLTQVASRFEFMRHTLARRVSLLLLLARVERQTSLSLATKTVAQSVELALISVPRLMELIPSRTQAWQFELHVARELCDVITDCCGEDITIRGRGELLLLERDALQGIGSQLGYAVPGVMNDITLGEIEDKVDRDAIAKRDPVFETEETFVNEYLRLTKSAIESFRAADTPRAVERLVAQLILCEYARENLEQAWNLLETTPSLLDPTFGELKAPRAELLRVGIECALHLKQDEKALELSWSLLRLGPSGALSSKNAVFAVEQIEKLGDLESVEQPLSDWFGFEIIPYLRGDGAYYLEAKIRRLGVQYPFVKLEKATVTCSVESEVVPTARKRQITFVCNDLSTIVNGSGVLRFTTKHFIQGWIRVESVKFKIKSQRLVLYMNEPKKITQTDNKGAAITSTTSDIASDGNPDAPEEDAGLFVSMQPLTSCLHVELRLCPFTTLRKRNLEVHIHSPHAIEAARIQIQAMDYSLELLKDKLDTSKLKNFTNAVATIPALISPDQSTSQVRVILEYSGNGHYEFVETVDLSLHALVQVQEHFRVDKVMSHFTVEPMTESPAVCVAAQLTGSQLFEVEGLMAKNREPQEHTAFKESPVSYVFLLHWKSLNAQTQTQDATKSMCFTLVHRLAEWECLRILETILSKKLQEGELAQYLLIVKRILRLLTIDVIGYATGGTITADKVGIQRLVAGQFLYMDPVHAERIAHLIEHMFESPIPKPQDIDFADLNVTVEIPVPDPETIYVHHVSLELANRSPEKIYVLGQPIQAQLKIETTKIQENTSAGPEFMFEVERVSENWSYTGQSRGKFTFDASGPTPNTVTVPISLIPLRPGQLLLPKVCISSEPRVESEVVVSHAATRLPVVPEVNAVTVSF